jgi:3-deoxy-D-manno-octulosonic-acid transferase
VRSLGDLKHAAPLLPVDEAVLATWQSLIKDRTVWLAASTHPGEENKVIEVHKALKADHPDLLTMIVPRHPERGDELAKTIEAAGLNVAQRSKQMRPDSKTDIYLGDSLGELGLFYRLAPIAFIGGSLAPQGGQNPLEAARLGCALLFGPHTDNFAETTALLEHRGAARRIVDTDDLCAAVRHLFGAERDLTRMAERARQACEIEDAVLRRIVAALTPLMEQNSARTESPIASSATKTADASP